MNILITSAGRRSYLVQYFKEALNGCGQVIACNSTKDSTALMSADKWIISPPIYSEEYIPFLVDVIRTYRIGLVISLFDIDLPILARHKKDLENEGAFVLVSSPEVIRTCNDKWASYNFLKEFQFNTPLTFLSLDDAIRSINAGIMNYPVVVKPRWGMGSISIFIADNEEELNVFYKKSHRHIFNTYLKYESQSTPENCVLIQEFITGDEYGLDVVNDKYGNHLITSVKRKLAMRSGETDGAITVDIPDLRQIGSRLAMVLRHIGNLDVDVLHRDGQYFVLEMNARFGGGYPFSHLAGMDLPAEIVRWVHGMEADASRLHVRHGVVGFKAVDPRVSLIH